MASKTRPMHSRTGGSKSPRKPSLSRQLAGLAVSGTERHSQGRHRSANQLQTVNSLRSQPARSAQLREKPTSLRNNVLESPFSGRAAVHGCSLTPSSTLPRRNVSVASSLPDGIELEWLSSMNRGDSDLFFQVISELLITPNSIFRPDTKNFAQTFINTHNGEVSITYPRMRFRNFGETDDPNSWELIPLEDDRRQPRLAAPCKYLLRTPFFKPSNLWQEWYGATWDYLGKNYIVDGLNGIFPPLSISVSTNRRALDFKRIVQALIHFNQLWPKVFGDDKKDPEEAKPQIHVTRPYISYHPDYWCAIPTNGRVFFHIRKESEAGERSIVWIQFVLTFVQAAVESPSLALIESYPVTLVGLNAFMIRGPPRPDGEPPLSFLL